MANYYGETWKLDKVKVPVETDTFAFKDLNLKIGMTASVYNTDNKWVVLEPNNDDIINKLKETFNCDDILFLQSMYIKDDNINYPYVIMELMWCNNNAKVNHQYIEDFTLDRDDYWYLWKLLSNKFTKIHWLDADEYISYTIDHAYMDIDESGNILGSLKGAGIEEDILKRLKDVIITNYRDDITRKNTFEVDGDHLNQTVGRLLENILDDHLPN